MCNVLIGPFIHVIALLEVERTPISLILTYSDSSCHYNILEGAEASRQGHGKLAGHRKCMARCVPLSMGSTCGIQCKEFGWKDRLVLLWRKRKL